MVTFLSICLDMILVTFKKEVKEAPGSGSYDGVYIIIHEDQINGRNAWIKGVDAIWYDSECNCWRIGPKRNIGTTFCVIYSTTDAENPTLVLKDWKYLNNDDFVEANPGDIIISNIEGKKL